MSFGYEDVGEMKDRHAAEDWAKRNNVDLRDLHVRQSGTGVEVGIRKSRYDDKERYDNRHGGRQDGFWR